jgi:protein lin-28
MSGFRSLGDEEEVEFECKVSDKGLEATSVTGPGGADCNGSHRRPVSKKRFRRIRYVSEIGAHLVCYLQLG